MSATTPSPEFLAARERHLRSISRLDLLDIRKVQKHMREFRESQMTGVEYLDHLAAREAA